MKRFFLLACALSFLAGSVLPCAAYTLGNAGLADANGFNYTSLVEGGMALTAYNGSDARVVIPDEPAIVAIWKRAFYNKQIHSVSIPEGVTEIGDHAFFCCTQLGAPVLEGLHSAKILCVGDSITWGSGSNGVPGGRWLDLTYPSQLETLLSNGSAVLNYGVSGLSVLPDPAPNRVVTGGAKNHALIKQSLQEKNVDVVLLMLGTNDAKLSAWDSSAGASVPGVWDDIDTGGLKNFKAAYRSLVESYQAMSSHPQVFCVIPPPVLAEGVHSRHAYRITEWVLRDRISPAIREIAGDLGCQVIDLRSTFPDPATEQGLEEFLVRTVDCVHPNDMGYELIAHSVMNSLRNDYFHCQEIELDPEEVLRLPDSLLSIGSSAFTSCARLRRLDLPEGLQTIGSSAFFGCFGLTDLTIPASVQTIGSGAFSACYGLQTVTILGSPDLSRDPFFMTLAEDMTIRAHRGSSAHLYAIQNKLPFEPIPTGGVEDEYDYVVENGKATILSYLGQSRTVSIPATLEGYPVCAIGTQAFSDRENLISVTLPDSVAAIDIRAFENCPELVTISIRDEETILPPPDPGHTDPYLHTGSYTEVKVLINAATSDVPFPNARASAECAVENLRAYIDGGLWYMGDCSVAPSGNSEAGPGERYLSLRLDHAVDLASVKIQWYEGGDSVTDIRAEKNRSYQFRICASSNGADYTQIYPKQSGDFASSGTGADFESYPCSFENAKFIRIYGYGSTGDASVNNNKFFAIRNVEVYEKGPVTLPENRVSSLAFYGCPKLETVSLPSGIGSCAGNLFYDCPALKEVRIYSSPVFDAAHPFPETAPTVLCGFYASLARVYAELEGLDFVPFDPPVLLCGDVCGDGEIALSDVTMLAKHLAGWKPGLRFVAANADCNGDGEIALSDVTTLAKHLAGWNVALG